MYKAKSFRLKADSVKNSITILSNNFKFDSSNYNLLHSESHLLMILKQCEDEIFKYTQTVYGNPFDIEVSKAALQIYFITDMKPSGKFTRTQLMESLNLNKVQTSRILGLLQRNMLLRKEKKGTADNKIELICLTQRGYQYAHALATALDDLIKRTLDQFVETILVSFSARTHETTCMKLSMKLLNIFVLSLKKAMKDPKIKEKYKMDLQFLYLYDLPEYKKPSRKFREINSDLNFKELEKTHKKIIQDNNLKYSQDSEFVQHTLNRICIYLIEPYKVMDILDKINLKKPQSIIRAENRRIELNKTHPEYKVKTIHEKIKYITAYLKDRGMEFDYKTLLKDDPDLEKELRANKAFSDFDLLYIQIHTDIKSNKFFCTWHPKKDTSDETLRRDKALFLIRNYFRILEAEKKKTKKICSRLHNEFLKETANRDKRKRKPVSELCKNRKKEIAYKIAIENAIKEFNQVKFEKTEEFLLEFAKGVKTKEDKEFFKKLKQKVEELRQKEKEEEEKKAKNEK